MSNTKKISPPPALTIKDLKRLKVGANMTYNDNEAGEVVETGYLGVRIKWEDGQHTTLLFHEIKGRVAEVLERLAKIRRATT